jgi:exodeoxyribonuclease X
MKIRVLDFETTGMPEERARGKIIDLCEIGWTDLFDDGSVDGPHSRLTDPGIPIPPEARAIHHISDQMVAGAILSAAAGDVLLDRMEPGDIFCAHNAAFERAFFGGGVFPWICTMVCAKHLWEDAPSFSNQALRYWLSIDDEMDADLAMPPHRAGPDTYVTAHILRRMTLMKHPTSLIELTNTPVLLKNVPFGKYEGSPWAQMDRGYLEWCLDPHRDFKPEVLHTARFWLDRLNNAGNPFA